MTPKADISSFFKGMASDTELFKEFAASPEATLKKHSIDPGDIFARLKSSTPFADPDEPDDPATTAAKVGAAAGAAIAGL